MKKTCPAETIVYKPGGVFQSYEEHNEDSSKNLIY